MVDVLIVGAGPIGLFLALLLKRQGLDLAIIDKREGAVFDPRAAVIWPRTAEVLAAQGLTPVFTRERRLLEGVELNVRGVNRGVLRLRGLDGPESVPWIIEQHRTEALLREALGDLVVRGNHALTGLSQDAHSVTARIESPKAASFDGSTLTWYWRVDATVGDGWRLFTHLDDASNPRVNKDGEGDVRRSYQPDRWRRGEFLTDRQTIEVPGDWDAPVVRVPVQPFEVTDLRSLDALGDVMFAAATDDVADGHSAARTD
jgi:hypothetical protein